jgi:hypothetical protein
MSSNGKKKSAYQHRDGGRHGALFRRTEVSLCSLPFLVGLGRENVNCPVPLSPTLLAVTALRAEQRYLNLQASCLRIPLVETSRNNLPFWATLCTFSLHIKSSPFVDRSAHHCMRQVWCSGNVVGTEYIMSSCYYLQKNVLLIQRGYPSNSQFMVLQWYVQTKTWQTIFSMVITISRLGWHRSCARQHMVHFWQYIQWWRSCKIIDIRLWIWVVQMSSWLVSEVT